jgi:hypothetical protein
MEAMTLDIVGDAIESVSYQPEHLRLEIATSKDWFLVVENDFVVAGDAGRRLDSRTNAERAVAALEEHVGVAVSAIEMRPNGALRLSVAEITLEVEPDDDYEAWHLTGPPPEKAFFVCVPGGGPADGH